MNKKPAALRETGRCFGIVAATVVYCLALNLFVVPHNIYCGGLFGVCQVIRTIIVDKMGFSFSFDIASVLYYMINIPIIIYAWFKISRPYILKTLLCLTVMTPLLAVIPITPILPEDRMASCLMGGILSGGAVGFYLKMGASGGGSDIIGLLLVRANKGKSIAKINLAINVSLYTCCMFLFDIDVVIYSIIMSVAFSTALDVVYTQNTNVEVKIITRLPGDKLGRAIIEELGRGVTIINSTGAYTNGSSRILYVVISKYEMHYLKNIVKRFDPSAFIVESGSVNVIGNFTKKLN